MFQPDLDYVYFTGDIVSHRLWETNKVDNEESITRIFKLLKKYIKIPVYPVLGNHEAHPVNQ